MDPKTSPPQNSNSPQQNGKKICRFCALPMPANASICTRCDSHQSRRREILHTVAGASGAIALVASGLTFVATNWGKLVSAVSWRDEPVLTQTQITPGVGLSGIVGNRGDGSIYISHLTIYWNGGNESFRIDKNVQPKEFLPLTKADPKKLLEKEFEGFAASSTGTPPKGLRIRTANNADNVVDGHCATVVFFTADSTEITRMNRYYQNSGDKLLAEPVEIEVHFLSAKSGQNHLKSVSGVATFVTRQTAYCADLRQRGWPE